MGQLIDEELSRDILAPAMKVHSTLKPGLDEKLYENALLIELVKRGHCAEQQKSFSVHYDGHFIGKMTITGLELAILINFKHVSLRWKRIVKSGGDPNGEIIL